MSTPSYKAYTIAIRELLSVPYVGAIPAGWDADQRKWSAAQTLASRDLGRAIAGDNDAVDRVLERAEGKPPSAPEDIAQKNAAAKASQLESMTTLAKLQMLLRGPTTEVKVLTEGGEEDGEE